MSPQNNRCGRGQSAGGFHIGFFAQGQHQRTHQAGHSRHFGNGDGNHHGRYIRTHCRHQGNRQQHSRNGHQAIHETHEQHVDASKIARQHAAQPTQAQRQHSGGYAHHQRDPTAIQHAAVNIAAKVVRAQPKGVGQHLPIGQGKVTGHACGFVDVVGVHGGGVDGAQPRREQSDCHHESQHRHAKAHRTVVP